MSPRTGVSKRLSLVGVVTPVELRNPDLVDAGFGLGGLWLVNQKTNFVATLDPATNKGLGAGAGPGGWLTARGARGDRLHREVRMGCNVRR